MPVPPDDDLWGSPADSRRDRLTTAFVTSLVALVMDIPAREIATRSRTSSAAARARHITIYLVHVVLGWQMWRVAAAFSRDRSTASHAVQIIEDLREDPVFDARLSAMEACVQQAVGPGGLA